MIATTHVGAHSCPILLLLSTFMYIHVKYICDIYVTHIPPYAEVETKEPDAISPLGGSFERRNMKAKMLRWNTILNIIKMREIEIGKYENEHTLL